MKKWVENLNKHFFEEDKGMAVGVLKDVEHH